MDDYESRFAIFFLENENLTAFHFTIELFFDSNINRKKTMDQVNHITTSDPSRKYCETKLNHCPHIKHY